MSQAAHILGASRPSYVRVVAAVCAAQLPVVGALLWLKVDPTEQLIPGTLAAGRSKLQSLAG